MKIEEVIKDEYWIEVNGCVFGVFSTIDLAVKALKSYGKKNIMANDVKIRHHFDAIIDDSVLCSEII